MPISSGRSARGVAAEPALIMARAGSEAMPKHLKEIARELAEAPHALVILDQAGWHTSAKLKVPANITLVPLPPASPQLNAQENIW
jgi:transposase